MMSSKSTQCDCNCNTAPKLIFACSGAADVGEISDLAVRRLTREGVGKMFCLAGIGGRVSGIVESTKAASAILAIDGCGLECAKNSLKEEGIDTFTHLCLAELEMKKGETPVNESTITEVVKKAKDLLAAKA